jgi:hypothetical protein
VRRRAPGPADLLAGERILRRRARARTALAVVLASTLAWGCSEGAPISTVSPPLKPGQQLDPASTYARTWPGRPALVKLNDRLVLAIPPQFQKFWLQRDWITGRDLVARPPTPLEKVPVWGRTAFSFHLPDFGGFTPDNYQQDFDPNRVEVVYLETADPGMAAKGATGSYPPNMIERLRKFGSLVEDSVQELHGLKCYRTRGNTDHRTCYGQRRSQPVEYILLRVPVPPYEPGVVFPIMQATYFTPCFGGLELTWRSHVRNFEHWREIDAQIWKYIEAWNVAPRPSAAARAAGSRKESREREPRSGAQVLR